MERALFAAGCFWGVEDAFANVEGVKRTAVGYAGGSADHPSYKQVCTGTTGHAETVEVEFDPAVVSYDQLLDVFFDLHDPTQVNRQGPDVGTQYRSAIFPLSPAQEKAAAAAKERWSAKFPRPIATRLEPAPTFWKAEEYHQQYFKKNNVRHC